MNMNYHRQLGIISYIDLNRIPVTVIGSGGIGSPTTIALAKMGVEDITIYDPDTIESHNLPNQFYRLPDTDKPKVIALKDIVENFSGTSIATKQEEFTNQDVQGLVISGVDSMDVRKQIWEEGIKYNPNVPVYIEARMGAELARIHTIDPCDPDQVSWYETKLYSSAEAVEVPCTERAIIYNVFMVAALIASQVKKFLNSQDIKKQIIFDLATLTLITT